MAAYELIIHDGDFESSPIEVDSDYYCYFALMEDVEKMLGEGWSSYTVRAGNGRYLQNDKDLMDVFKYYDDLNVSIINLYVNVERDNVVPLAAYDPRTSGDNVEGAGIFHEEPVVDCSNENVEGSGMFHEEPVVDCPNENVEGVRDEGMGGSIHKEPVIDEELPVDDDEVFSFTDDDDAKWVISVSENGTETDDETEDDNEFPEEDVLHDLFGDHDEYYDVMSNDSADPLASDDEFDGVDRPRTFDPTSKCKAQKFKPQPDGTIKFEKGQVFGDVYEFIDVLHDYCVDGGYELRKVKNDKDRVTVTCLGDGCHWRLHASETPDKKTFMVKTLKGEHLCVRGQSSKIASKWIEKKLGSQLRADPHLKIPLLCHLLAEKFGVLNPCRQKLYRAKWLVREEVEGKHKDSYARLPKYADLLKSKNPGSMVEIETHERIGRQLPVFKRIFICLHTMTRGFLEGCRPFLELDGCHLKGSYGGILLAAVSVDGHNGLFPVAFAVVESKCNRSWDFFLRHLYACIGGGSEEKPWTFMSDRSKSLVDVVHVIFPIAKHRFCVRHMYANFKGKFPGLLLRLDFWKCMRAYTEWQWQNAMDEMKTNSEDAYNYIMEQPHSYRGRHLFHPYTKSDHITNNMSESFNQWIGKVTEQPIQTMINNIRMKIMTMIEKRYCEGCSWETKGIKVTPFAQKRLSKAVKDARYCLLAPAILEEFQVMENGMLCGMCTKNKGQIRNLCDEYFSVKSYLKTYETVIHPLPETDLDAHNDIEKLQPPPFKRLAGRPRSSRRRAACEPTMRRRSSTIRCSICKHFGHNKKGCQRAPINDRSSQKRKMRDGVAAITSDVGTGRGNGRSDSCGFAATSDGGTGRGAGEMGFSIAIDDVRCSAFGIGEGGIGIGSGAVFSSVADGGRCGVGSSSQA